MDDLSGVKTASGRDQLERWADTVDDRRTIEDFLDWCNTQRLELEGLDGPQIIRRDDLLNAYFDIDAKRLDDQRRALLEASHAD